MMRIWITLLFLIFSAFVSACSILYPSRQRFEDRKPLKIEFENPLVGVWEVDARTSFVRCTRVFVDSCKGLKSLTTAERARAEDVFVQDMQASYKGRLIFSERAILGEEWAPEFTQERAYRFTEEKNEHGFFLRTEVGDDTYVLQVMGPRVLCFVEGVPEDKVLCIKKTEGHPIHQSVASAYDAWTFAEGEGEDWLQGAWAFDMGSSMRRCAEANAYDCAGWLRRSSSERIELEKKYIKDFSKLESGSFAFEDGTMRLDKWLGSSSATPYALEELSASPVSIVRVTLRTGEEIILEATGPDSMCILNENRDADMLCFQRRTPSKEEASQF